MKSPKTEAHEGHEERIMPLFPELRPYLQTAWDELVADFDPKISRISDQPIVTLCRDGNTNLRTQMQRIIRKAGLTPWPKLFVNLRATRATELAKEHPAHVAAAWLGHSVKVATKHYWQVTDADFAKAVGGNPGYTDAATGGNSVMTSTSDDSTREDRQGIQPVAPLCTLMNGYTVTPTGLEPVLPA